MALAATTVWEVRTAGSDTLCSGGFNSGAAGTDYSQQNAAQYTGTNLVIDGTTNTKVTSATHNFVAADVGNLMQITAGSGFTTGFFEIVSVAANAATLDRSAGTLSSTGGTFAVGGALLSPGVACANAIAQNTIWVKSGTYSITSTTANVVGGRLAPTSRVLVRGYQTTRADDAARPLLQASGIATTTIVTVGATGIVWNLDVDGAALTAIKGFDVSATDRALAYYCAARNCTNTGFTQGSAVSSVVRCYATGCTTQYAFSGNRFLYCEAKANTAGGFTGANNATHAFIGCLAYGNTGVGFDLGTAGGAVGCTAYNNSGAGFSYSSSPERSMMVNCIGYANGTYGFDSGAASVIYHLAMLNCAGGANTTADRRGTPSQDAFITLTADPFTNKAGGDFSLNDTAGGGAALKALGLPGLFAGGTTTSYDDIGAVQHVDPVAHGTGPTVIVSSGATSRGGSW